MLGSTILYNLYTLGYVTYNKIVFTEISHQDRSESFTQTFIDTFIIHSRLEDICMGGSKWPPRVYVDQKTLVFPGLPTLWWSLANISHYIELIVSPKDPEASTFNSAN